MDASCLDVGFFEDFKGGDCLVMQGSETALSRLAAFLTDRADDGEQSVALHREPWVAVHGVAVQALAGEQDTGIEGPVPTLRWHCSADAWRRFAKQVEALAEAGQGHTYLDAPGQQIQVMVSCNEYPNLFPRHAK